MWCPMAAPAPSRAVGAGTASLCPSMTRMAFLHHMGRVENHDGGLLEQVLR